MATSCALSGSDIKPECYALPCHSRTGNWSQEEDSILLSHHKVLGNKWTEISRALGGRTDNAVKNRFATLSKKQAKSKRKRSGSDQQSSDEGNKVMQRQKLGSGEKRRGGRETATSFKQHSSFDPRKQIQCTGQCQLSSHAHYAQLQAAQKPFCDCGYSSGLSSDSRLDSATFQSEWRTRAASCLEAIDEPPLGPPALSAPPCLPLLTARIAKGRAPQACLGSRSCITVDCLEDEMLKENTPPSEASTSEQVGRGIWEDELPWNHRAGQSFTPDTDNSDEGIAKTCRDLLGMSPAEGVPSPDQSGSAQWSDSALDKWLTANFTAEDMDALLPSLTALLPDAEHNSSLGTDRIDPVLN